MHCVKVYGHSRANICLCVCSHVNVCVSLRVTIRKEKFSGRQGCRFTGRLATQSILIACDGRRFSISVLEFFHSIRFSYALDSEQN